MQTTLDSMCTCERLHYTPDLRQRSTQEMIFEAILLQTANRLTLNTLAKCMYDGDRLGKVDTVVDLGAKLAIEWDPEYRHPEARIDADVKKTMRILEKDPEVYVVRIRVGAPRLKELESNDRCIVIYVPINTTPVKAMHAFVNAVLPILPEPHSLCLKNIPYTQDRAVIEVLNLRYACDSAFKKGMNELGQLIGDTAAIKMIASTHGMIPSLCCIVDGMKRLKTMYTMSASQLCKIMCDGVASALSGENDKSNTFFANLSKLKTTCEIKTVDQLCKIMCGSVASALSGETEKANMFFANLSKLKTTCEIKTVDQWCKIMCDGVASALSGENDKSNTFFANLSKLKTTCEIKTVDQLCKIMCGSVASALSGETEKANMFFANLSKLKTTCEIKTVDQWCKIMCDGVASALSGENDKSNTFFANLSKLKTTCEIKTVDQWCKIMCGSVASALSGETEKANTFLTGLKSLSVFSCSLRDTKYDLTGFVCGGIATRLKNGMVQQIIAFISLVGSMERAKTMLTKQPLLSVLDEFILHVRDTSTDANVLLNTKAKRLSLVVELKEKKRQRVL